MRYTSIVFLLSLGVLSGCAGLTQFPATSLHYGHDLTKKDPDYAAALGEIMKETDANKKRDLRNAEIDRRLRVIDLNFDAFVAALSKESVRANFGVAVAQVGLERATVAQTASQILSATSGALAGTQQAYGKAVLYDQAFSALRLK